MTATRVHSTHREEFRAVFGPNGSKTVKAWEALQAEMYVQYKDLMYKVARRYVTLEFTEALTVCKLGFCQGMTKYANDKMYDKVGGIHLCAHLELYMRSACQKAYRDNRNIAVPHNQQIMLERANKAKIFERDDLTEEEKELKETLERDVIPFMAQPSLDAKLKGEDDATIAEVTPDNNQVSAIAKVITVERVDMLKMAISLLPERQRLSLIHYRGLFGEDEKTLREIGEMLGVSHQMADNYVKQALKFVDDYIVDNFLIENYSYN